MVPLEGGAKSAKALVEEELKRADAIEAEMIQKLDKVSLKFREVYGAVKAKKKKKFSHTQVVSVEERLLVAAVTVEHRSTSTIAYKNIDILMKI